jgi:Undecaprenyl-phosphate glucose phosphotransferase
MAEFSHHHVMHAAASAAAMPVAGSVPTFPGRKAELPPAALQIAAEPVAAAYSPIVLAGVVRMLEFALIATIGFAVYCWYVVPTYGFDWYYFAAIGGIATIALFVFQAADIYHVPAFRSPVSQCARLVPAWAVVFAIVTAIAFFAKFEGMFSRVWLAGYFGSGLLMLMAFRVALSRLVRHWTAEGRLARRAVVVGGGEPGETLVKALDAQKDSDVHVIGMFDDRGEDRAPLMCGGLQKLGSVDHLVEFARRTRIDLVIFSLPVSAETRILQMLKKLWVLPVDIRLSAHSNKLRFRPRAYSYIGNLPVLDVFDKPITDWDVVMKWLFDKAVGGMLLLAAAPVMALTALAVKLDSRGPVFFKQKRYGFNNELIEVYKFRSMYAEQCDATAAKLVTKGDARVTPVGRFIRRTSLDELPQLINVVLKGNLSLVGPRPHAVHAKAEDRLYDEAVDGYFARHRVKPGITGWAQVNGWRGEITSPDKIKGRVEHDLYYIENWSVIFDFFILAKTPVALSKTEHAY